MFCIMFSTRYLQFHDVEIVLLSVMQTYFQAHYIEASIDE